MYKKVHFIFEALPFIYILKEDPHRRTGKVFIIF